MAGATAGGRAGTAAAIKRRRKKEALSQVCADKLCQYSSYDRFYLTLSQKSHEDKVDAVLLKRFHHFDENNEGKVSKGELKKMLNAKGMKCDFFRPEPF